MTVFRPENFKEAPKCGVCGNPAAEIDQPTPLRAFDDCSDCGIDLCPKHSIEDEGRLRCPACEDHRLNGREEDIANERVEDTL